MSCADFLEKRMFSTTGMVYSSCHFLDGNTNIARQYDLKTVRALPAEYVNILGSRGMSFHRAEGLCLFSRMLWANTLLKPPTFEKSTKPQYGPITVPQCTPLYRLGLGWDSVELEESARQSRKVMAKNGGTLQFNSQLYLAPSEKLSVALIFVGRADPAGICTQIMQVPMEGKGVLSKDEPQVKLPSPASPDCGNSRTTTEVRRLLRQLGKHYQGRI